MEIKESKEMEYTIDLVYVSKFVLKRIFIVILCAVLAAVVGFTYSTYFITPKYASKIKLYVNNSTENQNYTISTSQIAAAQSLVKTYGEILDSRSTLERIIEKSGVKYTTGQLSSMIKYASSNETEFLVVTVTSTDPYEASKIANTISKVLPVRIAEIIEGAKVEVVDSAIPNPKKTSPNVGRNTVIATALGLFLSAGILVVFAVLDNTIHDEEYIIKTYDCPILGKIPDLTISDKKSYRYMSRSSSKER